MGRNQNAWPAFHYKSICPTGPPALHPAGFLSSHALSFVFLLGPHTAHVLLTGSAHIQIKAVFKTSEAGHRAKDVFESQRAWVAAFWYPGQPAEAFFPGD